MQQNVKQDSLSHYSTLERQVIHAAFFSCAETNVHITIINKSSHKFLQELVARACKFDEEEKMTAKDLEE